MQADASTLEKWKLEYIFRLKFFADFYINSASSEHVCGCESGEYVEPDDFTEEQFKDLPIRSINTNENLTLKEWEKSKFKYDPEKMY